MCKALIEGRKLMREYEKDKTYRFKYICVVSSAVIINYYLNLALMMSLNMCKWKRIIKLTFTSRFQKNFLKIINT